MAPSELKVHVLPVLNDNYIFVAVDESSGQALVVDPAESEPVLEFLSENRLQLSTLLITHHHPDHTGGVEEIKATTGAQVIGAIADRHRLPPLDTPVKDGDIVSFAKRPFLVKELPGHTTGHIGFYCAEEDLLFSGDTFFAMGCGRLFEGTAEEMLANFQWLRQLPPQTQIFCTHEYTLANAEFAQTVDPDNQDLKDRKDKVEVLRQSDQFTIPTTVAEELLTNPFARYDREEIQSSLGFSETSPPAVAEVFATLRQRKDAF